METVGVKGLNVAVSMTVLVYVGLVLATVTVETCHTQSYLQSKLTTVSHSVGLYCAQKLTCTNLTYTTVI